MVTIRPTQKEYIADTNYSFNVSLVPLKYGKVRCDRVGVYRADKNKIIAVVGPKYRLIPHSQVLEQIEESVPISIESRKIEVCYNGAYLFATYESPKIAPVFPRKGDTVNFGIQIINSYNGRLPVCMRLYAKRLVCLNGMTAPKSVSILAVKHLYGANIVEARKTFDKKIEEFVKFSDIWRRWASTKVSKGKMETFLKQNVTKGARTIIQGKFEDQKDNTIWGLYNALTWFGTHINQTRGIEPGLKNFSPIEDRLKDIAYRRLCWDSGVMSKFYKAKLN